MSMVVSRTCIPITAGAAYSGVLGIAWEEATSGLGSNALRREGVISTRMVSSTCTKLCLAPLPDLQPDDKEGQVKRQEELIRTVRVVSAAVGMDYEISTKDDIPDKSPGEWESMDDKKLGHISWMTHGNADKWFAREARQACGFQLPRDAKEKEEAEKEKKEIMEEEPEEGYSDDEFGPPGPGDCNHQ